MNTIVTMTLDDLKKLPPLSDEEIKEIEEFDEKFDDPECPPCTKDQLLMFRPWYWFRHSEDDLDPFLDNDIVNILKRKGIPFKTKLNTFLREALASGQI